MPIINIKRAWKCFGESERNVATGTLVIVKSVLSPLFPVGFCAALPAGALSFGFFVFSQTMLTPSFKTLTLKITALYTLCMCLRGRNAARIRFYSPLTAVKIKCSATVYIR